MKANRRNLVLKKVAKEDPVQAHIQNLEDRIKELQHIRDCLEEKCRYMANTNKLLNQEVVRLRENDGADMDTIKMIEEGRVPSSGIVSVGIDYDTGTVDAKIGKTSMLDNGPLVFNSPKVTLNIRMPLVVSVKS